MFLDPLVATWQRQRLRREAAWIEMAVAQLQSLDDAAFAASLRRARDALRARQGAAAAPPAIPQALAHAASAAARALHLRPSLIQLQAALAMYRGKVVWLPAASGKSLAIALAAILHAWMGRPCRVVAASVHQAQRDYMLMQPLFSACGLTLACQAGEAAQAESVADTVIKADVVYACARQLLAVSLRGEILRGVPDDDPLRLRLRGLAGGGGGELPATRCAYLVDDADLVLIDEAMTPLTISVPSDNPLLLEAVSAACAAIESLQAGRDYEYLPVSREIRFRAEAEQRLPALGVRLPGIWHEPERRDDLIRQALGVRDLLDVGRHYRVEAGKVVILDEGLVRLLVSRAWTHGLLQAIEARAGVAFTPPVRTLARLSYPAFFRRQAFLGGCGRGHVGAGSLLRHHYGLACLRLAAPEQAPAIVPRFYATHDEKLAALVEMAAAAHAAGEPVLILTRRVADNEAIRARLAVRSIASHILDAQALAAGSVGALVSPAGVTLASSSLARDIRLPEVLRHAVRVLLAEAHDLAHADQRAASLSSAGVVLFVALEDELLQLQLPRLSAWLRRQGMPLGRARHLLSLAQMLAARVQRRQSRQLAQRDTLLNQQLAFTGARDIDPGLQGRPSRQA